MNVIVDQIVNFARKIATRQPNKINGLYLGTYVTSAGRLFSDRGSGLGSKALFALEARNVLKQPAGLIEIEAGIARIKLGRIAVAKVAEEI
jgi:hypothetical protein